MKLGALIPVRLSSERLPGKALLPIAGRPVIVHLLDRLFASRYLSPERVVVCTTTDQVDDPLVAAVENSGARVFRGSRDDIIDRFYNATKAFGFDAFIQADGDDPCTDTYYMDLCMERLLEDESLGIVLSEGLPIGINPRVIRTKSLRTVWEHHTTEQNDTGFTYYFTRTELCKKALISPILKSHCHETARLTLDYPEDLAFFRALFDDLYVPGKVFDIGQIVSLLRQRPELIKINDGLGESYAQRTSQLVQLEYQIDGKIMKVEV